MSDEYIGTATYSPEDNKLRIYPFSRLSKELYDRVKNAGYSWAPKQELFVAPMWTPSRADLAEELCGEIGDEDKSLVERATQRSERFGEYSEKREADADRAKSGVESITKHIPLGQPILIGHHSERHARKDAERIQNGMNKAIKMWETSKYWTQRAAGARAHADYKADPEVRARRIKGLNADLRKQQKNIAEFKRNADLWSKVMELPDDKRMERAIAIAGGSPGGDIKLRRKDGDRKDFDQSPSAYGALTNSYPNLYAPRTLEEVIEAANEVYPRAITRCARWVEHYTNRLAYETAMLSEDGAAHLLDKPKRPTQLPLCNYKAETITYPNIYHRGVFETVKQIEMTQEEYAKIYTDYKGTRVVDNSHRVRTAYVWDEERTRSIFAIFLTDSKVHEKPAPIVVQPKAPRIATAYVPPPVDPKDQAFRDLKETAKNGVKVVTANQLFPTPPDIARRMCELAQITSGQRILEPSAGTGNLITAIRNQCTGHDCFRLVVVEINPQLVTGLIEFKNRSLYANDENFRIIRGDFLEQEVELNSFDRVVMNPPFENGSDIRHIQRARSFLKQHGRLVAICADGPRQQAALRPHCVSWESLGPGIFKEQGTSVRTALIVMRGIVR